MGAGIIRILHRVWAINSFSKIAKILERSSMPFGPTALLWRRSAVPTSIGCLDQLYGRKRLASLDPNVMVFEACFPPLESRQ